MKVLEKGTGQRGWAKECFCTGKGNGNGGCNAKLMVEQTDLYITSSGDYAGGRDYYTTFTCCDCGVETDIDVPSNIKAQLGPKGARKDNGPK